MTISGPCGRRDVTHASVCAWMYVCIYGRMCACIDTANIVQ